jgi:hypothetical protein
MPALAQRRAARALATIALACALSSCGSATHGNGVASQKPAQILAAAQAAANSAHSVHVAGSIQGNHASESFDVDLLAGRGASGTVTLSGASFQLIEIDGTFYLQGSPAFYERIGGSAAAKLLEGKWLKARATGEKFRPLTRLTDLRRLVASALSEHTDIKSIGTSRVDGRPVVGVSDLQRHETIYVATSGKPYPIEIAKSGSGGGRITFDRWDAPVTLSPPERAIDISKLQAGG